MSPCIRRLEHVSRPAQGVDHRRPAGVDLPPQVGDVQLDDVRLPAEVVLPDAVEDLRLGQHAPRVPHEVAEQLELGCGQVDLRTGAEHLVAVLVQHQVPDHQVGVGGLRGGSGPAEQGAQPGHHLLKAERLGDVVVATGGEPRDPVLDGVPGRQEEHGDAGPRLAQAAQHVQPGHVREHHVQHDDVRVEGRGGPDRGTAVQGRLDLPALVPQRGGEQVAQHRLVVNHQDAYGSAVLVGKAFGRSASIHPAIVVPSGHAFLWNPYVPPVGSPDPDVPTAVEEAGVLIAPGPQVPDDAAPPAQVAHDVDPVSYTHLRAHETGRNLV